MPTFSAEISTPAYVLVHEGQRIGPSLTPDSTEKCDVIYGFSNKAAYELFRGNSDIALTPYPLVKGYLRNHIEQSDKEHKLVATDVEGPLISTISAITMAAALDAQEKRMDHVTAVYLLTFDEDANAYQLAKVSATT